MSAVRILPNGAADKEEIFELANACKAGKIEIGDYHREETVQFTLERGNGEKHKIVSAYGENIQSDQNGFYAVLQITENTPFIIRDSI